MKTDTVKICTKCKVSKTVDQFGKNRRSSDGLQWKCKQCRYEETQAWKAKNPDRWKQHQKSYWDRHKDKNHATQKAWREKTFASDPVAWRKRKVEEYHRRKRAGEDTSPIDLKRVWERDEGICYLCLEHVSYSESSCDHIIPISRDGLHVEDNVAMVHPVCNSRKGAYLPEELTLPFVGVT